MMKAGTGFILIALALWSCEAKNRTAQSVQNPIEGTWRLISGTTIENGDTVVTDYTKDQSFIKIINDTHFAFLKHALNKEKDSVGGFGAGGGRYTLKDSSYTEHLEYCSDKNWEGHDFTFTVAVANDTLVQSGIEKVEKLGVNRVNIERYVRATR